MLIVFDDDPKFTAPFKTSLPKMGVNIEVIECNTKEQMRNFLKDKELMKKVKVLVFDLSASNEEAESLDFDILTDIQENYESYPIPIFIHSAFANHVEGYNNLGTLFKVPKGPSSIEAILIKIQLFFESGFLDIFCPGGLIEQNLYKEIHKAFLLQFEGDEVGAIIESIKQAGGDFKLRTKNVFERIAVRALYQNILSAKKSPEEDKVEEIKVNAVEHYYRRTSEFKFWTGDIFTERDGNKNVVLLTPRCNLSNNKFEELLLCKIKPLEGELFNAFKSEKNLKKGLTDDVTLMHIAERYRFLTRTPQFEGGIVDFNSCFTMKPEEFDQLYKRKISLIDDLTNDIVRKFSTYILRGGVSVTEIKEAQFYFQSLS
jgi:hypothetical protein